jgi:hypothetical protein
MTISTASVLRLNDWIVRSSRAVPTEHTTTEMSGCCSLTGSGVVGPHDGYPTILGKPSVVLQD